MRHIREVILCPKCRGEGVYFITYTVDYHRNETETDTLPCEMCSQTGKLLQVVYEISDESPFSGKKVMTKVTETIAFDQIPVTPLKERKHDRY